jgi:hypothetical protein
MAASSVPSHVDDQTNKEHGGGKSRRGCRCQRLKEEKQLKPLDSLESSMPLTCKNNSLNSNVSPLTKPTLQGKRHERNANGS